LLLPRSRKESRTRIGAEGWRPQKQSSRTFKHDARLLDAKDVVKLLAETINQVRRGEVDPKVANAVGYLGGLLMKAIHETEIESRFATLEAAHKRQPATLPEFNLAKDEEEFNLDDDREHSDQAGTNGDN
jgi:hypothetical protein